MKNLTTLLSAAIFSGRLLCGLVSAVMTPEAFAQPAPVEEIRPGRLPGYLHEEDLPDALALIPSAPAPDSAAYAWEQEVNQKIQALRGGPRWDLATLDNDLTFPNAAGTFSCALSMNSLSALRGLKRPYAPTALTLPDIQPLAGHGR